MPTIALDIDGKVILRGGLPSCTCCGCSCAESLEDVYEVEDDDIGPWTVTRASPCWWLGLWEQAPYGYQVLELRCEEGLWQLWYYYDSITLPTIVFKDSPRTASPVGWYGLSEVRVP